MFLWKNCLRVFAVFFNVIVGVWEGRGQLESKVNTVRTVEEQHQSSTCSQMYASKLMKGNLENFLRLKSRVLFFFAMMKTRTLERKASGSPDTRHRAKASPQINLPAQETV